MEAVGTWPRPTIAISGRCFRMIATPVSREFVFQRTSNEPIVRPRMSMCRIASWSVSMIRQLMLFIPPLFHKTHCLHRCSPLPAGPGSGTSNFNQPPRDGCLAVVDRRDVLNPKSHECNRLDLTLPSLGHRDSGVVYGKGYNSSRRDAGPRAVGAAAEYPVITRIGIIVVPVIGVGERGAWVYPSVHEAVPIYGIGICLVQRVLVIFGCDGLNRRAHPVPRQNINELVRGVFHIHDDSATRIAAVSVLDQIDIKLSCTRIQQRGTINSIIHKIKWSEPPGLGLRGCPDFQLHQ